MVGSGGKQAGGCWFLQNRVYGIWNTLGIDIPGRGFCTHWVRKLSYSLPKATSPFFCIWTNPYWPIFEISKSLNKCKISSTYFSLLNTHKPIWSIREWVSWDSRVVETHYSSTPVINHSLTIQNRDFCEWPRAVKVTSILGEENYSICLSLRSEV